MKKNFFTSLFVLVSLFSIEIMAQNIMDVPPGADLKNLVPTIAGDTTATGERANPNRIYRLERDAVYILDATLIADYSLRLIAADGDGRPPMLVPGKNTESADINPLISLIGSGTINSFKDILFNGVTLDRVQPVWTQAVTVAADDVSITFEGCVFNSFGGGTNTMYGSNHLRAYFRDCVWRNGVSEFHPFIGQQVQLPALQVDTLVVTNCTYFNNNSFWLFQENGIAKYAIIEHNTIFGSVIDDFRMRFLGKGYVRSNLWYSALSYGDTEKSRASTWYFPGGHNAAIAQFTDIPDSMLADAGMTRADRVITLTNNAYFWPQPIQDYWNAYDYVFPAVWMNDSTKSLFDDNTTWPGLTEENNLEMDPKFADNDMDTWVTTAVADWCKFHRDNSTDTTWAPWGMSAGTHNYDAYKGADILTGISWPLPENMEITDATLLTAGHDGLPVGNLNWDPLRRAQYVEPGDIKAPAGPIESQKTAQIADAFYANWTVTPTHAPMDGVTGLSKGVAGGFGDMGVLVRMNSSGKVDARNGGGYEAENEFSYEAGSTYKIEVTGNVKTQKYTIDVSPDGGAPVRIGTDYGFRDSTPQDTLGYFSTVINELEQWGGVPGSRLNPSFMDGVYELIFVNNDPIEEQTGKFDISFDVTPTAAGLNGGFGFANGDVPVNGWGNFATIIRCNSQNKFDARNGGAYEAMNEVSYTPGTKYTINMSVDIGAKTYDVTVTPEGGSPVVLADDYGFRATLDTISTFAKQMVIGGLWGGNAGDIVVTNISNVTDVALNDNNVPKQFALSQNYPNPFNPSTVIKYSIPKNANVNVGIYNSLGQRVKTLVNQKQSAGYYTVDWNGKDNYGNSVSSGVYFYRIKAGDFVQTRKMMLMK